jgi:EpsI family protein
MKLTAKSIVLLALMLLSAALGAALRPRISLADERPPINLKTMVPMAFGEWQELLNASTQIIDPRQKQSLEKIYSEILTRTYVNRDGYRIMLSIAYGKNKSDSLQLHKTEICYPAQGFALLSQFKDRIQVSDKLEQSIPITRLTTSLGQRAEPVTYWTTVGDKVVQGQFNKKITEMRYAFSGHIPDGMLVRFSSIDTEPARAFAMQTQFAAEMIRAIDPASQRRFVGNGLQELPKWP